MTQDTSAIHRYEASAMPQTETSEYHAARLEKGRLDRLGREPGVIDYGAIIHCTSGEAVITIDFKEWKLSPEAVMTLFPGDVIMLHDASDDFNAEMLCYDKAMLREASLHIEQAVYSQLRQDRCRTNCRLVTRIVRGMFDLLNIYMEEHTLTCLNMIVLYQLKSFFLGFYDYISKNGIATDDRGTRRTNELFNSFMETLETEYIRAHDVAFYASALNITPKYLNNIVKRITRHTTKEIIDHYVTLQIKLYLSTGERSIKQAAWDFHFSDTAFFCRYFKQHTGITPQQFRKLRIRDARRQTQAENS